MAMTSAMLHMNAVSPSVLPTSSRISLMLSGMLQHLQMLDLPSQMRGRSVDLVVGALGSHVQNAEGLLVDVLDLAVQDGKAHVEQLPCIE